MLTTNFEWGSEWPSVYQLWCISSLSFMRHGDLDLWSFKFKWYRELGLCTLPTVRYFLKFPIILNNQPRRHTKTGRNKLTSWSRLSTIQLCKLELLDLLFLSYDARRHSRQTAVQHDRVMLMSSLQHSLCGTVSNIEWQSICSMRRISSDVNCGPCGADLDRGNCDCLVSTLTRLSIANARSALHLPRSRL